MKLCPDDPRLTAFVLGELDPGDAAQVEAAVLEDPDLQAAVSDLRGLQENLVFELVVEPELELTRVQHKEVLASGRASLMADAADAAEEEKAREEAMAAGILEAIMKEPTLPGAPRVARAPGSGNGGTVRIIAMSGIVAACVAFSVSWLTSERSDGRFASGGNETDQQSQGDDFFDRSDVQEFAEPLDKPEVGSGGGAIAAVQATEPPPGVLDTPKPIPKPKPIPITRDMLDDYRESTLLGAGVRAGKLPPAFRFPQPERSPSDLWSRFSDDAPEPPEEWVPGEAVQDRASAGRRTIEMPYQWTREFSRSYIPTEIDTVSYNNVRRRLRGGDIPHPDSVHIEEMINFFDYDFKPPGDGIFGVDVERAKCPWDSEHQLVRVAVHASAPDSGLSRTPRNYVFLIDTSSSMRTPARLGMLSESAGPLADSLGASDKVTIFTYDGDAARLVAGPLTGSRQDKIRHAFLNLDRSRKMAGTPIRIAYRAARNSFIARGENRVVVVTDENLEAGAGSPEQLVQLALIGNDCKIELTAAGVGGGGLDAKLLSMLETKANVRACHLDGAGDAARFFGKALAKPAVVLANRVAIDVDFNSDIARSYRLIGFANRPVNASARLPKLHADVRDGYALTALYEVIPMTAPVEDIEVGSQGGRMARESDHISAMSARPRKSSQTLLRVRLRYDAVGVKLPKHAVSPVADEAVVPMTEVSPDFQFAAAVAGYGMLLRGSPYGGAVNTAMVVDLAEAGLAFDPHGLRREFVELVRANEAALP